jgi:hypothetical protein
MAVLCSMLSRAASKSENQTVFFDPKWVGLLPRYFVQQFGRRLVKRAACQ